MISQQPRMEPTAEHNGDVTITFRELVAGVPAELGQRHLILDLSGVQYINSGQLSTLVTLHKKCNAAGGRLILANVGPHIYDVCQRIKLNNILDVRREESPKAESRSRPLVR